MTRAATDAPDAVTRAWTLMRRFMEAHGRHHELAEALGFSLGGGRGKFLLHLRGGPATLRELAQANGVDAPYATLVVDKLESLGLVERRPHPDDRRRKLVTLTPTGHATLATADAILLRPPPAMDSLTPADLDRITSIFGRLIQVDVAVPGSTAL